MKKFTIPALAAMLLSLVSCTAKNTHDSTPVSSLDLQRYLGKWYEIARYDHSFERGVDNATAEYTLKEDGKIKVVNSGWKDGKVKVAEGKAKCPDPTGNPAHLKVAFFLFFYADYNILYLTRTTSMSWSEARVTSTCGSCPGHLSSLRKPARYSSTRQPEEATTRPN